MIEPDWIWYVFIFAFGCCIGSFLNVVIYRLPRDKSLVKPASACPACGKGIRFYDNIPLISWLILGGRCRYCKAGISPRYFVIELLTGLVFTGVFFLYFRSGLRPDVAPFLQGGWFIYLISIIMLAALIAASAIDLELWVIPLSICWFVTAAGLIASTVGGFLSPRPMLPFASPSTAALSAGAAIGLIISLLLLNKGFIKTSYEIEESEEASVNHRLEVCKEIVFLLPIIVCAVLSYWILRKMTPLQDWWVDFSQMPFIAGFLGSFWGYLVGCGVVWATRIFGTLGFGKEAMGLGDVHLMGAVGAVIGPIWVVIAFFIAPFFGLAWAVARMFFKKTHEIPYGPFLSLGVFAVMILKSVIIRYLQFFVHY